MKTFWWPLFCLNTFYKGHLLSVLCMNMPLKYFCYSMQYGGRTVWESDKHSNRIIFKNTFPQKGPSPLHQFVKVVMDDGGPKYEDIFLFTLNPPLHILFSYAASLLKGGRGHVTCLWRELGSGGRSWSVTATGMTDSRLPEKRCLKSAPLKLCISRHSGVNLEIHIRKPLISRVFFIIQA